MDFSGQVFCWGENRFGQLGYGDTEDRGDTSGSGTEWKRVELSGRAKQVTVGVRHSCALMDTGTVKCWGGNAFGMLGYGDTQDRGTDPAHMGDNLPEVDLGSFVEAVTISAGKTHTCAVVTTGGVKCWGGGMAGALGYGDISHRGNTPGSMGDNLPEINLGAPYVASDITVGDTFACAVVTGAPWNCGDQPCCYTGRTHDCGDPESHGRPGDRGHSEVPGDHGHSEVPGDHGHSVVPGDRGHSEVPVSPSDPREGPEGGLSGASSPPHDAADAGGLPQAGGVSHETFSAGPLMGNWLAAHPAMAERLGVGDSQHGVKCWGTARLGQLGLENMHDLGGTPERMSGITFADLQIRQGLDEVLQVRAGSDHVCALIRTDLGNTVKCWGKGSAGQLGNGYTINVGSTPNTMGTALYAVNLGGHLGGMDPVQISAGGDHTCAVFSNHEVKCWGDNSQGQLGTGSNVPSIGGIMGEMGLSLQRIDLGTSTYQGASRLRARQVYAGRASTCVVTGVNNWEFNDYGTKCFGANVDGELGYGDKDSRGRGPGTMGDNLPSTIFKWLQAPGLDGAVVHSSLPDRKTELGESWNNYNYLTTYPDDGSCSEARCESYHEHCRQANGEGWRLAEWDEIKSKWSGTTDLKIQLQDMLTNDICMLNSWDRGDEVGQVLRRFFCLLLAHD